MMKTSPGSKLSAHTGSGDEVRSMAEREFSKKCGKCRQRAVALAEVEYTTQVDHDGRKYTVIIPSLSVPKCGNCGTIVLDEEANRKISEAFRTQAGLLAPEEIRRQRKD